MADVSMKRDAILSDCGKYRYVLHRRWGEGLSVLWVMLNPSTADHVKDDATIRKCVGFTKLWGYEALTVVNLFAFRSRWPEDLITAPNPYGPDNDAVLWREIESPDHGMVVLAWGARVPRAIQRPPVEEWVLDAGKIPLCLGETQGGEPRHPLVLAYNTRLATYGMVNGQD